MPRGILKPASAHPVAAKIREAIGAADDAPVLVSTPQFTRESDEPGPASPPADREAFEALRELPASALRELGLRQWGRRDEHEDGTETGPMLWLLPGEWYSAIPAGLRVTTITFRDEAFIPGQTDDDIRFGCLAYGIIKD